MSHQIRFFWASHSIHHSSEIYSLSAGLRLPWTGTITGVFLFWAWMPLLGFNPLMVIWFKSASIIYQFWLHTETIKRMPRWFEVFFNTPYHIEYIMPLTSNTLIRTMQAHSLSGTNYFVLILKKQKNQYTVLPKKYNHLILPL